VIPPIVLGCDSIRGVSYRSAERAAELRTRFERPERIEPLLRRALQAGITGMLTPYHRSLLVALDAFPHRSWDLYPVIPDMSALLRDVSDSGAIGAVWPRIRRLTVWQKLVLGVRGLREAGGLVSRDFRSFLAVLLDLELAPFHRYRPRAIFLSAQITDLALAFDNAPLVFRFADLARRRFRAEPALETHNLGTLLPALDRWGAPIRIVASPVNLYGMKMRPTQSICEELIRASGRTIVATKTLIGELIPAPQVAEYLARLGVGSAALDADDPSELQGFLDAFRGGPASGLSPDGSQAQPSTV